MKAIQICGTGSAVGKSVIVTALCRIFLQDGHSVSPFKAQNMSLNSFVTEWGGEMGRAQVVQAQACRLAPHVDMNPILIKPTADTQAQIILQGKPAGNMSVKEYIDYKGKALKSVKESFKRLKEKYEVIVIEGAGSPAEINLKSHDIVNMKMAEIADAPVILLGDIDKGGVFASFVGTLELLSKKERDRIKGFIINKFRGDKALLEGGIRFLQERTKKPVLGVIPFFRDIRIPEEDSVALEKNMRRTMECEAKRSLPEGDDGRERSEAKPPRRGWTKLIHIAVIMLPHMSNFTDFDALENEPDVMLRYIKNKFELDSPVNRMPFTAPDVIIIPGTKNTIADLKYLKDSGLADKILSSIVPRPSSILIGICGGYQMLGEKIRDYCGVESKKTEIDGLGLLPIATDFKEEKILTQVKAKEIKTGLEVTGYEIHHGRTRNLKDIKPVFELLERHGDKACDFDGAVSLDARTWGTYIHGVFDEDAFRRDFLNRIRIKKGQAPFLAAASFDLDKEFDKLACLVRKNIDMDLLYKILFKK